MYIVQLFLDHFILNSSLANNNNLHSVHLLEIVTDPAKNMRRNAPRCLLRFWMGPGAKP